jgi:Flp pilus assembly protein TadG
MWKLVRDNRGTTAVEFGLVMLPVLTLITGIIQTGWAMWADNLLHAAVDTAARCGAVQSTTSPCSGSGMITAANNVFAPLNNASSNSASFAINTSSCSGSGVIGTYTVRIAFIVSLTLTAKSCYPTVVVPS